MTDPGVFSFGRGLVGGIIEVRQFVRMLELERQSPPGRPGKNVSVYCQKTRTHTTATATSMLNLLVYRSFGRFVNHIAELQRRTAGIKNM